jgi:gas vesicle protein
MITIAAIWIMAIALLAALAYAEDRRSALARERIRREEADAWAEQFEREAQALAAERDRLRKQLATVQEMHAERTRQLLAQNYYIIHENIERRRQR